MIADTSMPQGDRSRHAYELKRGGKTYREIAESLGVSITRARHIVTIYARRNGLPLDKKRWGRVSAFRIERY